MLIKFKATINGTVDTSEYPMPTDNRITVQIKDDLKEVIETNLSIELNSITVCKIGQTKNEDDEVQYYDP